MFIFNTVFFQHFSDKVLDPLEQFIEDLITERCYEGQPYVKIKSKTELKLEKAHQERLKNKKESLYEKMKAKYDLELFSETAYLRHSEEIKKWNGTFFDTKTEQQDYLECICGTDQGIDTACSIFIFFQITLCQAYFIFEGYLTA